MKFPLRLIGILSVCAVPAGVSAASWTPVSCPEAARPLAGQYELVRMIEDFEDGPGGWASHRGVQQAESAAAVDAAACEGRQALRVDYRFAGKPDFEYVEFGPGVEISEPGAVLGFWCRFDARPLALRLRIRDKSGETHQLNLPRSGGDGWSFTAAALEPQGLSWGGDGNGKLDYPVVLDSIVADRPERGYVGSGSLRIDGVGLFKPIEKSHALAIEASGAWLGNVYLPGETVRIRAKGEGDGIRWQIRDYFGRTIANGEGAAEETLISRTIPEQGYFECRIALVRGGRDADVRLFSWAALPNAGKRNPFVGMGCHFRGSAYPLECMDLLARYGLTEFRDEISWSSVEHEKGRYEIPPYGAEFVARAEKLGLSPLLILDYGNRLYDDGGFPNSSQAVAAYAEYSAAMARMLRGKVRDFEIWNEWTIGCGMRGKPGENTPERYGRLLRAAYRAIRAGGEGEVTVVGLGGEHSGHHFEQIRGMVRSGGAGSMDAFSVHCYRYPRSPEETDLVGEIRTVAAMVEAEGGPARLWVTEIGWPTHRDERGVDERTQARYFVRTMALLRSIEVVEKVYWYDFKNDGLNAQYNEDNFGLIRHQKHALAPKRGVVAAAVFSRLTAGAKPLTLWQRDGAWAVILSSPEGQLAIAWDTGRGKEIKLQQADAEVFDAMGNRLAGLKALELTEDPVYVVGRDLSGLFPASGRRR